MWDTEKITILNIGLTDVQIWGWDARDGISKADLHHVRSLIERTVPAICNHPDFWFDPCFVWTGATDTDGYGRHRVPTGGTGGSALVHRYIYQKAIGDIPPDITVDHACSNRACCNLRHLRLLPLALNRELGDHRKLYSH